MQEFEIAENVEDIDYYLDAPTPRRRAEINEAIGKLEDQIAYDRHAGRSQGNNRGSEVSDPKVGALFLKLCKIRMEQARAKYGVESGELGPFDDLKVAEMKGKLSALIWVLGYDWGAPDV